MLSTKLGSAWAFKKTVSYYRLSLTDGEELSNNHKQSCAFKNSSEEVFLVIKKKVKAWEINLHIHEA